MKKNIYSFIIAIAGVISVNAQKVFRTSYKSDADKIIFVTDYKSEADMIV